MDLDFKIKRIPTTPRGQHQFRRKAQRHNNESTVGQRPAEVPPLNLGKLGDWEEEDGWYVPESERQLRVGTPDSSSTLSWGPAISARVHQTYLNHSAARCLPTAMNPFKKAPIGKKPPPWEEEKVIPEDLPPPSERHRKQYLQYQEELRDSFRLHSQREQQPCHQAQQSSVCEEDLTSQDGRALVQQCYTSKPYTPQHSQRKLEVEDLAVLRRKEAVVEQVMVDQLSRAVISDPDQNWARSEQHTSPADTGSVPLRFRRRTLHETKVKTRSALTENLLSNKLRFDARILSRNGRDASRELIGFFFAYDKTLTVYEYRHFGKNRTNALPFIPKGCYRHECGRRMGTQYSIHDFYVGANLSFSSHGKNLPENMKQRPLLLLRITDLDELAKDMLLASTGDSKQGLLKEEHQDRKILKAIQGVMQDSVRKRSVRTLTGLGKLLRGADASGDGVLGKEEIHRAMEDFHLTLPDKDLDAAWRILDQNGDGQVDYGEFFRGVMGEMNEFRKSFVRKAYMKLDPNKSGSVPMTNIEKFYCAKGHPQVVSGESTEGELKAGFIQSLREACLDAREVSYCEFEDYYEGLSIGIPYDQDFANVLKNSWGI
ncbi:hypothetical protein SKAU_G00041190 [Synaphobranchus kaupii]|uniref:EF-hand domain-containing protein n=1 Tax=Synaphobranchus kaupii TaxID=118154 RepID=A0A9Q1G256_SYNKA|nr:hypothetical protein SKAU_G00041190 [Synaphobranchus kaupii]